MNVGQVLSEGPMTGCREKEYKPPRRELLKNYEIRIQFYDLGCLVQVGCRSIGFNNVDDAMDALNAYVKNPAEETEKWNKLFNKD